MKKAFGKVYDILPRERAIRIQAQGKLQTLFMSRRTFSDFSPYFFHRPYIFVLLSDDTRQRGKYKGYEIDSFIKIVQHKTNKPQVFYDLSAIKRGVKNFLNRLEYKLFIDLEFSLPPYTHSGRFVPEIVQYGAILESPDGEIIFEDSALVKPKRKRAINARTLKFLSKNRRDFDKAASYQEFYKIIEEAIHKYDAKIIAWGKNDFLVADNSFDLHNVKPLDIRSNYVNLMQLMKNYYNEKNDLGLFATYEQLSECETNTQKHDAFEDALLTREIFHLFKQEINEDDI